MPIPPTAKKLRTLAQIAAKLQEGDHVNITRLIMLKGFCADPDAAFSHHIDSRSDGSSARKTTTVSRTTRGRIR